MLIIKFYAANWGNYLLTSYDRKTGEKPGYFGPPAMVLHSGDGGTRLLPYLVSRRAQLCLCAPAPRNIGAVPGKILKI